MLIIISFFLFIINASSQETVKNRFSYITGLINDNLSLFQGTVSWMVQMKNGTILIKEHLNSDDKTAYTDDTCLNIGSGSKLPAMTVIMKLIEEGELSLTNKISEFYTNNEFSEKAGDINLLQLMTHQSGYGESSQWLTYPDKSLQESVLGIAKGGIYKDQYVSKERLLNEPGEKVLYGDIGMQIACAIAEIKTKQSFSDLFNKYLGEPLGMVGAKFDFDGEDVGYIPMADRLQIRMIDYANFMLMLMNDGELNGKKILKKNTVEAILQNYTGELDVQSTNKKYAVDDKVNFGIGNWIQDESKHSSKGFAQFYNYFDTQNEYLVIFYFTGSQDDQDNLDTLFSSLQSKIESKVLTANLNQIFSLEVLLFCLIIFYL